MHEWERHCLSFYLSKLAHMCRHMSAIIYFCANATFPDSASITNADVASFAIRAPSLAESNQCPCGVDAVKSQRSGSALGAVLTPDP